MKGFINTVLSTVSGIFVTLFIFGILISIVLLANYCSNSSKLKEDTVVTIRLDGILKDRPQSNPVLEFLGLSEANETGLNDIVSAIKKAKENDKVKGIYIQSGLISASSASLLEIRNELKSFKESGKFIIAYADAYQQGAYFITSIADKVILNPQGNLDLHGLSSSRTFYTGLFEKLGIEIQIFKVGTYKSAVEPYTLNKMSDANKEQVSSYINDIWKTISTEIAASRNISVQELNSLADTLILLREAKLLVNKNLIDTLMYESDVREYIAKIAGKDDAKDINFMSVKSMGSVSFIDNKSKDDKIAILYAEGSIVSGNKSEDINDKYYVRQIIKLKDDKNVKAVVLRVNSPGGSAYASEQIWKAISDLKEKKPVVVSMGGYAASGGYYISCNASKIFAQPSTLTGSIGIFGMFPNMEGLTQKIGLSFDNVKTNKYSDFGDITRPMKEDEKAILQQYIEKGYDLFLTRCSEGRGIPRDSIEKIAEGRVWTGNQAVKNGLVDAIGGMDDAVKEAAKLAKIEEYSVDRYPEQTNFWKELFSKQKEKLAINTLKEYFGNDYELIKTVKQIKEMNEQDFIQARLPFDFEIK